VSITRPPYWKVQDLATLLRVNDKTVRKLIEEGAISAIRVGRAVRIPDEAVQRFTAAHMKPSTDPADDREPAQVSTSRPRE
jgi:excisionase family DNA binding protein